MKPKQKKQSFDVSDDWMILFSAHLKSHIVMNEVSTLKQLECSGISVLPKIIIGMLINIKHLQRLILSSCHD